MKKCKIISIYDTEDDPLLINKQNLRVWDAQAKADVINKYLAQGYEVKQMMWAGNSSMIVYLEKDV